MGLRTKQVGVDQEGPDWGQNLLQSGAPEMPKRHQSETTLKCPRCGSMNTKFCYYNNYNKSQPRHFCKSCKRHWTKGGTLRNVPVGGCRKNKRPKITSSSSAAAAAGVNLGPNFTSGANDQKGLPSNIFYQALIRSSSPLLNETTGGIESTNTIDSTAGLNPPAPDRNPNSEFQFSSLEMNGSSIIPASYQPKNTHDIGNIDSKEESSVTTANIDYPCSSGGAWLGFDTSNCSLELPAATGDYWNWSEIDALTSAEELNISWEEDDGVINDEAKMMKP